jgi:thiosulfate dehydrogenase [quinone] large subunit
MKRLNPSVFLLLRIALGWLFLYKGVIKLADPDWSAEAYLRGSYGILSPCFHFLEV